MTGLLAIAGTYGCATKPHTAILGRPEGIYVQVAFSPDGRSVAAASRSAAAAVVFDVTNRLETARFRPPAATKAFLVEDLAYTPDGRLMVAIVDADAITVWDATSGKLMLTQPQLKPPCAGALSPDGQWLAVSGKDQPPIIWDVTNGTRIAELRDLTKPIRRMAFSYDGRWLATADSERNVRIWEVASGGSIGELPRQEKEVESLEFSPDGSQLAISAGAVSVWKRETGQRLQDIAPPSLSTGARIAGATWSVTALPMAILSGNPSLYTPALPSAVNAGANSFSGAKPSGPARFSPDGSHLAVVNLVADLNAALGHETTQVRVFDLSRGELVSTVAHHSLVGCAAFGPNGRLIATAGRGVEVWDWQKAKLQKGKEYPNDQEPFVVRLETNVEVAASVPLARLAPKRVRLAAFGDQRSQAGLGARRAGFGGKLNDIVSAQPAAEAIREGLRHLCAQCGHTVVAEPADLEISGTLRKCSVETPVSLTYWRVNATIELELRVTNDKGTALYSAAYTGQSSRKTMVWVTEDMVQKTCNEALANLLGQVATDPKWTNLQ